MKTLLLIVGCSCIPFMACSQGENWWAYEKGELRLGLKLPHINHLSLNPNQAFRDNKIGFNGYGIGLEYSYQEHRFLETSFSFVLTFELPFPAPIDRAYNKALFSYYWSVTDNFTHRRFTLGYGVNYATNFWREWYRDLDAIGLPTTSSTNYSNQALGMTLNTYYGIGETLNLGLIYRPSLFQLNDKAGLTYEHLISLEVNWRIRLFNWK